jgi:hypothetical protein
MQTFKRLTRKAWRPSFAVLICLIAFSSSGFAVAQPVNPGEAPRAPVRSQAISSEALTKTSPYQKEFNFSCSGVCQPVTIPAPGTGNQLTLKRISCFMSASAGSVFRNGNVELLTPAPAHALYHHFTAASSTPGGIYVINSEVDVVARNSQTLRIFLNFESGSVTVAQCTVAGTLGPIP